MKSSLYRELTAEALSEIIQAALHVQMKSGQLLTGGLFNTTYLVDTKEWGRVVLRLGPVNRHLLIPFEHRLMTAEEQVYALCRERRIPVPQVLAVDVSKTRIDRDFMITRYISARPMNEVNLNRDDKARICRDIGQAAARMHRIVSPRFGRVADVAAGGGFSRWSDCLKDELSQWEKVAAGTGLYSETEHRKIREILDDRTPLLDEIHTPCLIHNDLWEGNLLISEETGRPKFAAVIDADRALWGDPEFEFSSIRWMCEYDEFWQGYERRPPQDSVHLMRRDIYHLLCCLWNSYVYLQEYNQPEPANAEYAIAAKLIAGLMRQKASH